MIQLIAISASDSFFRIGTKHQEIREKQTRGPIDYVTGAIGTLHDMDDDEMDPNYARVNHFREPCTPTNIYRSPSPPQAGPLSYPRDGHPLSPERDHLEGLYAKVNKPYHPMMPVDRWVKLIKTYSLKGE